jgi:hypothetical protein
LSIPEQPEHRGQEEQQGKEREEEVVRRLCRERGETVLGDLVTGLLQQLDDVEALDDHDRDGAW